MNIPIFSHLDLAYHPSRVHSAGDIHRIAPDIVLGLLGSDDPRDNWSNVDSDSDLEIVERMLIDVVELFPYSDGIAGHRLHVVVVDGGALVGQT